MDNKNSPSKSNKKNTARDYVISILLAVIIALAFRTYVFARADVDGESMMSTLHDKDVIFVEKLSLLTHSIKRGQIIIFNSHNSADDIYVKRVIAVAGDEIEIKDGKVFLNGSELNESYLDSNTITTPGPFMKNNAIYKVEKDHVFVLGDNREDSIDSRILGPINIKDIKGHAIIRVYPFSRITIF
ncbi:signal peptidase I [Clostridium sp. SYSU_GA19001]|uniref:signal peptidase I n=1 Tax=Clostridium caldaquaticum TaxID=2940653 RepID=UPI0020774123|nr:signal peptidase I [Clostridium caldaquaticum]MCM8709774.1 signal peptidase I [Clostridium caldaquaticum]